MTAISINHVSIHAQDLERSAAFYEQLFGMQRIPTPTFAFPVAWLRLGRPPSASRRYRTFSDFDRTRPAAP